MLKNKRIFLGIPVKVNLSNTIEMVQTTVSSTYGEIKWVYGKNLHITLAFLGDIIDPKIKELSDLILSTEFGSPFNCVLNYTGIFPDPDKPHVFWLGIDNGKKRIISLVKIINEILYKLNIPTDNRLYIPHIAIGRVINKKNAWKIDTNAYLNAVFSPINFSVNSIYLYQSELTFEGLKFKTIVSRNLQQEG